MELDPKSVPGDPFRGKRIVPKLTNDLIVGIIAEGVERTVFDSATPGFGFRLTAKGKPLWIARARAGRVRAKITIGTYPDKTLTAARSEAHAVLADIRDGKDPRVEKAARRAAIEAGKTTVSELADRWLAEYVRIKLKPRTIVDYERIVADKIKPRLGALPVSAVTKGDVISFHAAMAKTPRRANYVISTVRALMTFAEDVGLRPVHSNPAKKIKMYRQAARERFLSEEEIGKAADAIARAAADGKVGPSAAAGLRLALFTGARSGEITAAKWSHVDWQRKLIRLPDSKTNEARTIHLSEAALEVLRALPHYGSYIVAGRYKDEPHQNLSRAWIIARAYGGLEDVRLHDLRHSFASLAAGRGVSLYLIGRLLGHRVPATTQRYAHLARDVIASVNEELGAAMQAAIEKSSRGPDHHE